MTSVRTVPTAGLSAAERTAARELMDVAFGEEFTDDDWDHALGGLHFLIAVDGRLVAHAAVVQRRFLHDGRALRGGYVEAVAVHPDWRRRGLAGAAMAEAERIIDLSFDLGALSASAEGRALYLGRGWLPWQGSTWVMAPQGLTRTADEDESTLIRQVPGGPALDVSGKLACDWRDGDVW